MATTFEDRLKAAEARATAAEARVSTKEFTEEEEQRRRLADLEARERVATDRERAQMVAKRLDVWRDKMGDKSVCAVVIDGKPHFFIVSGAGGKAYKAWQDGIRDANLEKIQKGTRNKVNADDVSRAYTAAGILEWNGLDLEDSEHGKALHAFLRDEPAILGEVQSAIMRLDGATSEERKS